MSSAPHRKNATRKGTTKPGPVQSFLWVVLVLGLYHWGVSLLVSGAGYWYLLQGAGFSGALIFFGKALPFFALAQFVHWKLRKRLAAPGWGAWSVSLTVYLVVGYGVSLALFPIFAPFETFNSAYVFEKHADFVQHIPGRAPVPCRINRHGFRGPDWSWTKAERTVRIALVGDSFVFGDGVEWPETLGERLDALLRERFPQHRWEVLNLGIPGNNLMTHLRMADGAIRNLDSDFIVLCLTLPDDFAPWDRQSIQRAARWPGLYSLGSFLLGNNGLSFLSQARRKVNATDDEGNTRLMAAAARWLANSLPASRRPGIVVQPYTWSRETVLAPLTQVPGLRIAKALPLDDALFLQHNGHPNGVGNRKFAETIAGEFTADDWAESIMKERNK